MATCACFGHASCEAHKPSKKLIEEFAGVRLTLEEAKQRVLSLRVMSLFSADLFFPLTKLKLKRITKALLEVDARKIRRVRATLEADKRALIDLYDYRHAELKALTLIGDRTPPTALARSSAEVSCTEQALRFVLAILCALGAEAPPKVLTAEQKLRAIHKLLDKKARLEMAADEAQWWAEHLPTWRGSFMAHERSHRKSAQAVQRKIDALSA